MGTVVELGTIRARAKIILRYLLNQMRARRI
jgi:hypothetical protein